MLVDANILLYAVDTESPFHDEARDWLEAALNGSRRVAIPWVSTSAFLRIATNPRAMREPLAPADALTIVESWLDADPVWSPAPGRGHREILRRLLVELDLRGPLVADASLAALCIEHGLAIVSADSDFARFTDIEWINPVAR
ncbi:MAG TPA: type II toxin-antitoxin system VapC family toxin [Acidimicrobiia bacterium]|nr:type II toxin-antitoxin system VapC family toxin [Acidimicrobiia bacterium]